MDADFGRDTGDLVEVEWVGFLPDGVRIAGGWWGGWGVGVRDFGGSGIWGILGFSGLGVIPGDGMDACFRRHDGWAWTGQVWGSSGWVVIRPATHGNSRERL